jgi:hypothetical protein
MNFFKFFINFVSSCARYVYDELMCTGYVHYMLVLANMHDVLKSNVVLRDKQ